MSTFKARGLIIKETKVNDTDKCLKIFFKDYGKMDVWARNCRSSKSKIFSGTNLFTYADFIIYKSSKSLSINQVEVISNFYNLSKDLDSLAYATYFLELVEKNILEGISLNDMLLLLLKNLNILSKDLQISKELIRVIFELKFLQIDGYRPIINCCYNCSKPLDDIKTTYFGTQGVLCQDCKKLSHQTIQIDKNILYVINHILSSDINNLFDFNVSNKFLTILIALNKLMLMNHFNTNIKIKYILEDI